VPGARIRYERGVASLTSVPNAPPGFDLAVRWQGPWDDPLIFPDPESLIRRSPASAPLLDAVKDRKTRDAVRSVLERFIGGGENLRRRMPPLRQRPPARRPRRQQSRTDASTTAHQRNLRPSGGPG